MESSRSDGEQVLLAVELFFHEVADCAIIMNAIG
jgi:hypothetical protein